MCVCIFVDWLGCCKGGRAVVWSVFECGKEVESIYYTYLTVLRISMLP